MTRMLRSHMDRAARLVARAAAVSGLVVASASVAHAQWWPTGANGGHGGNNGNGSYGVYGNAPQNSTLLFEWQGRVDREVQFDVGNRGVDVRGIDGDRGRGRLNERGGLPRGEGRLIVQRIDGRGAVDVVQQPASTNRGNGRGYGNRDGVVRIRDTQGGADTYRIRVYWQSTDNTYGNNNGRNDRNDRNGRNGDYDRGRRRP